MPELINPSHILTMDVSELDACLVEIRARRLRAGEHLEKAKRRKAETTNAGLIKALEKHVDTLNKKLTMIDKQLELAERAITAIFTLRLQYDDMKEDEI